MLRAVSVEEGVEFGAACEHAIGPIATFAAVAQRRSVELDIDEVYKYVP